MEKYSKIGQRYPKLGAINAVNGLNKYTADLVPPYGVLYGKVIRSPYPRARVVAIDTSAAEADPNVKAVLTPYNTPATKYGVMIMDETVLTTEPKFVGDEVAAVVAVSEQAASEAAAKIKIQYEELPAVFDVEQGMAAGAVPVHANTDNVVHRVNVNIGDADAALAASAATVKQEIRTTCQVQAPIEHYSCLCSWSETDGLVVQAPVQDPSITHANLAHVLGLPMARVRVIQTLIGGSYGSKLFHVKLTYICCLLAMRSGQTVYMTNSTEEEFIAGRPRVPARIELEIGADAKGLLTAQKTRIYADNGAYASYAPGPVNVMATRTHILYRIPVLDNKAYLVYTNKVPTAGMRGFGNISMLFALETAVDELARKLNIDPVEFRKRNIYQAGQISPLGWKINSSQLADCLDVVGADAAKWRKELGTGGKGTRGIGIACGVHVSSNRTRAFDGASAAVRLNEDGSATILSGDGEVGQGIRTIQAMIVAEVLGIGVDQVSVAPVDTAYSPYGLGVFADRGTTISGNAVMLAAQDARQKALALAGEMLTADPAELSLTDGMITAPGGQKISLAEVARFSVWRRGGEVITGRATFDPDTVPLDPRASMRGNPSTGYTFCAIASEVAVDQATGEISVLRISTAHDSGTIINPLLAEGQVQGAVVQGLGYAMMEGLQFSNGRVLNRSFRDYKIPTIMDIPEISVRFVESHESTGPFGAKGIGQTGSLLVAPSIANAVYDAVGVRLTQVPFTREYVWRTLRSGARRDVK